MTRSWTPLSLPNLYIRHEKVAEIYKFLNVGHNPLYIIPHGTSKDIIPPDTFPQAMTLSHLGPALDNKTLIINLCVTNPILQMYVANEGKGGGVKRPQQYLRCYTRYRQNFNSYSPIFVDGHSNGTTRETARCHRKWKNPRWRPPNLKYV